jgi:hypothetical protein
MNHFAKVCKQSARKPLYKNQDRRPQGKCRSRKVHLVDEDSTASQDEDTGSEDSAFQITHCIGSVKSTGKQWFVNLNMKLSGQKSRTKMKCQIDTGSTCNLMSHNDYCALAQDGSPPLWKSKSKLTLYDGSPLQLLGQANICCEHNGKQYSLEFQIVETKQKSLLSAETCEKMNIIQLNETVHSVSKMQQNELTKNYILDEYKDVFSGLGCLPGEYHFDIDESVTPVQHQPRRIPQAFKQEVKDKIHNLEEQGILQKVTEPTDWISSMVAVKRPGKLRICIDPKDLNKA